MTTRALIYCRLSQDRTGAGMVVARQEEDCRRLAAELGWAIADVIVDNDVSAYRNKPRPGYQRLLATLEAGEAEAVIVWHADRLHRSPRELEGYIEICDPRNVMTKTVRAGSLDLSTASGRMLARMLGSAARYESEQTAGRTKAGKDDAASRGEFQGGQRLYGWAFVPKDQREPGGSALRVLSGEAEVVQDASRRVLAGESLRSVAKSLNEAGKPTARGGKWTGSALRKVLMRPSTAGLRAKGGEVLGVGKWEALIPEAEWRGLVALLSDPGRRTNTDRYARSYLGSGLYVCGVCGGKLGGNSTAGGGPGERRAAYRCRASDRDGRVHVVREVARLDEQVVAVILGRLREPDAASSRPTLDLAPLHTEASALRARMDLLARDWVELEMSQSQFLTANGELRRRLASVDGRLAQAQASTAISSFGDLTEEWPALSLDRQRAVVDLLVEVTVLPRGRTGRLPGGEYWDPSKVEITWKVRSQE